MSYLQAGAYATATTALVSLYVMLGGPLPATSGDIKRLDRNQAEQAVELYQNKVNSLILLAPGASGNEQQRAAWQEQYARAKRELEAAENRKIELSK
jgi:hypothetical protein